MKLLYCKSCKDVLAVRHELRACTCGSSSAVYIDALNAEYFGETAVPLGFTNSTFRTALAFRPLAGDGFRFTAFVIPQQCDTITYKRPLTKGE